MTLYYIAPSLLHWRIDVNFAQGMHAVRAPHTLHWQSTFNCGMVETFIFAMQM